MKKRVGILMSVLILAQAGCSYAPASSQAGSVMPSSQAVSSETASSKTGLNPGEAIQVTGRDSNFQLHGIDFLDNRTGWMIQDRYGSGSDSCHSQLLATTDGGETWTEAGTDSLQLDKVRFVGKTEGWAVSEETVENAKVPVGDSLPVRYSILHTSDGGQNWSAQWKDPSDEAESDPALWFGDAESGFALVSGALLKTSDGGAAWTDVPFGVKNFTPVKMFFVNRDVGWTAGISDKNSVLSILQTSDGGKSWSSRFRKDMEDQNAAGCIGIDFLNAKEGWFLTSGMATGNSSLYHTDNGGRSWKQAAVMRGIRPYIEGLCFTDPQTGWLPLSAGPGPIDGGISVTRDGGKTFHIVGETDTDGDWETRKVTSAKEIAFQNKTLGWAVGENLVEGNVDDLLKTTDGGDTWEQVYPKPEPTAYVSFLNSTTGYGLGKRTDAGALLKTTDGGQSWQTLHSFTGQYQTYGVSFLDETEGFILAMPESASDTTKLVVLHTADGGKTWSVKSRTDLEYPYDMISYFGFADPKAGFLIEEKEISRTADGGKTWKPVNSGQNAFVREMELSGLLGDKTKWRKPAGGPDVNFCAASLLPGGTGFVLAGKGGQDEQERMELLTTSDAGKTWSPHPFSKELNGEPFDPADHPCVMRFTDAAHGWILAAHGLLFTSDGGRNWVWQ